MYGYDRKPPPPQGSWRETFGIMRVVFEVIVPLVGVFLGVIALLIGTAALALWHAPLALIPLALVAAGVAYLIRRDRRDATRDEERIFGPR